MLKINAGNQSMTRQKSYMASSNFLQQTVHIMNLMTQLNYVSLFHENMHFFTSEFTHTHTHTQTNYMYIVSVL